MKNLHLSGTGIAIVAVLIGCRAGMPSGLPASDILPTSNLSQPSGPNCSKATNLTVEVRVPSNSEAATIDVTDSVYGDVACEDQVTVSKCKTSASDHICYAKFDAPSAINDIEIEAYSKTGKKPTASGIFPVAQGSKTADAVLGGTITSVSVIPFQPTLPVGQTENVWVVASDAKHEAIIGTYHAENHAEIHILGSAFKISTYKLTSSLEGESLTIEWKFPLKVSASTNGALTAKLSSKIYGTTSIAPASGIVYYHVGKTEGTLGPGPVAINPKNNDVYFAVNDESGCTPPPSGSGSCQTLIGEINSTTGVRSKPVNLSSVPGVSQLYFTHDGALWIATYQPMGSWNAALPILRMAPGPLSQPSPLPSSFGEGSGFVEYPKGSGNLWISGCIGMYCTQDKNGSPVLSKTTITGYAGGPIQTVDLPLSCATFGYLGFSVGDVAFADSNLYVLGLNDGSSPPARGTIWELKYGSNSASCLPVPADFNPSAYFATVAGSGSNNALVFGAGGNSDNSRWPPTHGFYELTSGVLQTPAPKVDVTVSHVSYSNGLVYYIHSANLVQHVYVSGLGTYQTASGNWNVFPAWSFSGAQSDDGVVAVSDGAWFTADSVCSGPDNPWHGVCLGRAKYLSSSWGAVPGLVLPPINVGAGTGFGPLQNPENVHSGPFDATSGDPNICTTGSPPPESPLTLTVQGRSPGVCPILLTDKKSNLSQPLVTKVSNPARR
jgi:hypothetical protein